MGKYRILAIERQYASDGSTVGKEVADRLKIAYYENQILEMAAKRLHVRPENIAHMEETATKSLLYDLAMLTKAGMGGDFLQPDGKVFLEESRIIKELTMEGRCVIVGRCAGGVLKERKDCLKVFIYADLDQRIETAVSKYQIPREEALAVLKKIDKKRSSFYKSNTDTRWDDWNAYHLCLNRSALGIDGCADIITQMMKQ